MELHNYRKLRDCRVEFPDGVIGIIGPNGVGKSSLIEAIAWALYGSDSTSDRTKKEGIRWTGAGPAEDCSVLLEFEMSGDRYRLLRSMRGRAQKTEATLEVNGNLEASGDTAVNEVITSRLGMDYKAFYISVFARQKELNALSTLIPSERKALILRMLDVDVLKEVIGDVGGDIRRLEDTLERERGRLRTEDGRDRVQVLREEKEDIDGSIQELGGELGRLRGEIGSLDESLGSIREERDRLQELEEGYRLRERAVTEATITLKDLNDRRKRLEAEIEGLRGKEAELGRLRGREEEQRTLLERKESMEEGRRSFERRRELEGRREALDRRGKEVEEDREEKQRELRAIGSPESNLERVEASISEAEIEMSHARQRMAWISSEIDRLSGELRELSDKREEIEELGPDSSCPTCERPLGDHQTMLLGKLSDQIEAKRTRMEELETEGEGVRGRFEREERRREVLDKRRRRLSQACSRATVLRTSIEHLLEKREEIAKESEEVSSSLVEVGEPTFDRTAFDDLVAKLEGVTGEVERYRELSVEVRRISDLEREMSTVLEEISGLQGRLEGLRGEMEGMEFRPGELRRVQERYENLLEERKKAYESFTEKRQGLTLLRKDSSDREERLAELLSLRKGVEDMVRERNTLDKLRGLMNGFWVDIMSRIAPTLSKISSSLFTEMTDSRYEGMDLDGESYEVYVYEGGERYALSRFSGGESDLANLCLRLAISNVIADRAGSGINFLILDEIFGSQDQVRKRNIMTSLNRLTGHFNQIILITHIDDVKDFMGHLLRMREKEDGTSDVILET